MSSNMGTRTARDAGHRIDGGWHESPGAVIRTICPICKKKKHSSQPHPKCSRKLQQLRQQGVIA